MPTAPHLRMERVSKRFGATIALDEVNLSVNSGEILALVGENGAGKSTLMKILSGAHQPDAGQIWLDEVPYRPRTPLEGRLAGVAMIYQELSLAKHLSVMENILLGMEPTIGPVINWREVRRRAGEAMEQLGRPDIPLDAPVGRLSLAQQQLVEIARALAIGCRVLVLDEPSSSLAKDDIARLFDLVRRLRGQGHAIVYISHFLEEVKQLSDRFLVLRDGKTVGEGKTADASADQIVSMMVGRKVEELYPRSPRKAGEIILDIQNISGKTKPRSASLQLHRGEILGIAGLIGSGRTELLRAIFGLDRIKSGAIRLGMYQGAASPSTRWNQRAGIGRDDRKSEGLALELTIASDLTLSKLPSVVLRSDERASAQTWIERLGIRCRNPFQKLRDLSGGNQQKVALARLLHHDVDVLLLDEPTRGIDVGSKAEIYRIIDQLASSGKAILMVSSYLPELLGVCDRIAVMHRGVLGEARAATDLDEHRIMLEATGAGAAA